MHQFAGQTPDDKIKFLFKVYDIDGKSDFYIVYTFFQTLDSHTLSSFFTYFYIYPYFGFSYIAYILILVSLT